MKNILKIVQTPARFYPSVGGVEKYVYTLSKELVNHGNTVIVFCANEPKTNLESIRGISVKRLSFIAKVANTNITPLLFFKMLNENFDIIHTHIPTPWSADISMLIALLKQKPLILTYHNDLEKAGKSKFIARIYSLTFLKLLFNVSKKIIVTNSEYISRSKYLKGYENKIVVIPNGVEIQPLPAEIQLEKQKEQIFFLSVLDQYHKYKGLDYLLRALPDIVKEFPKVKLVIGGEGVLIGEYKRLAQNLGIAKNLAFIGYVNDTKLKKLYQESTIFVLPSVDSNEGFGIVLLEAMAMGTPVVTTSETGVAREIKNHNAGIVVTPKDSMQLTNAIIKLLNNPNLSQTMGKNGKRLVEEKYDWKKIAKQIESLYEI